jgi:uncharacterized repeat protein (TIGR01451 family)
MKTKCASILKLIGSLFALALIAVPPLATAGTITITQIDVVVGSAAFGSPHYCSVGAGCANEIWNLNGGVTLAAGETLILTQSGLFGSQQRGGENFDTSDRGGGPDPLFTCSGPPNGENPGAPCTVQIFINAGNGLQLVNTDNGNNNPLSAGNDEPTVDATTTAAFAFNEALAWTPAPAFTGTNFTLDLGYADNIHGHACPASAPGSVNPENCFPQPVWCSTPSGLNTPAVDCPSAATPAATFFIGAGRSGIGNCIDGSNPNPRLPPFQGGVAHANKDANGNPVGCYDAGALRITANPPNLTIAKSPKNGTFTAGSQVSYTIVVTSNGPAGSIAHHVVVSDPLPTNGGLTWTTATTTLGTCSITSNVLNCQLGDMATGSSATITVSSPATTPVAACQDQPNGNANAGGATATDNEGQTVRDFGDQTCTQNPQVMITKFTNGADANNPNGTDVPDIPVGGTVTWRYEVKNTGNVPVARADVVVTDDHAGVTPQPVLVNGFVQGDTNTNNFLDPGETWIYQATGTALNLATTPLDPGKIVAGVCTHGNTEPPRNGYVNQGKVTIPGSSATDPSAYCNPPNPNVTIIKFTNGADANDPNAAGVPNIAPGGTVTWTYRVTNTGNTSVPRAQVVVTDNVTGVTPTFTSEITGNGDTSFDPGEVWLYTATGTALNLVLPPPGGTHTVPNSCTANGTQPPRTAYTNIGTVTIPGATAQDPSSYCNPPGPNVTIIKFTNGADANDPNAAGVPSIAPGGTVTWTYRVTNTGNTSVPRANVVVTDNVTGVTPTFTSEISGNGDTTFDPGEVWLYTATGTALNLTLPPPQGTHLVQNSCTAGGAQPPRTAYTNIGTVTIPGATASDPSSYCNPSGPAVTIVKFTNGADANDPNAAGVPNVAPGGAITWTYRVTNTGNTSIPRASVVVTDNVTGVTPTFTSEISGNGDTTFNPGEVWLYTATGTALNLTLPPPTGTHLVQNSCTAAGTQPPRTAYTNIGTVTIPGASATDPSSYCNPPNPAVTIVKLTNGADANDPNGAGVPNIAPGGAITWTYRVTNTGNTSIPRANVVVTDNVTGVTPAFSSEQSGNGDTSFDPGEVWIYTATGTALNLVLPPPAGTHTVPNSCTANGTQPPRTAYTNVGTVTIPGATAQDPSSYCNPPNPNVTIIKFTNGADANDPNAAGVPNITPGGTVTWTYRVTNTGNTSIPRAQVAVTDNVTGVAPTFTSEITGNGDTNFDPGEVWLYTATGTALDLTLPPPAGTHTVPNSCTGGGTQPPRTAYTNIGTVTIPGATAQDPSSYCNPPGGKTFSIGPSSMEGAIKISNGDWVNGGYSLKTNFTGPITVAGTVTITGPCSKGAASDTVTVPLPPMLIHAVAGADWLPTGDANSVLSWEGAVLVGGTPVNPPAGAVGGPAICGGVGVLNASHGAVYNATISGVPPGGHVTFRFKYRDPFAKGKPNTDCLDTSDPNRAKADVCGASWSETKTDP